MQKVKLQIVLKKFYVITETLEYFKNSKMLFAGHMLLVILKMEKILKRFTRKNWNKKKSRRFMIEIVIKKVGDKF